MKGMNFMEFICDSKYIILPASYPSGGAYVEKLMVSELKKF